MVAAFFLLFLFLLTPQVVSPRTAPSLTPMDETHLQQTAPEKKTRRIGSAWQEAIQHVYIPSASDTNASNTANAHAEQKTVTQPTSYVATPAPSQPKPDAVSYHQPEQNFPKPSPEEMQQMLAHLEMVFNDIDDDDDLFFYSDDDFNENFS